MKILKSIQKIPGGLMVVPLLIGAAFNTFCPGALEIGGFTTALFKSSASALIALFCLCNAAQIDIKQVGSPLIKGVGLTASKFIIGAGFGWLVGKIFGMNGVLGITPLALIAAVTNSNGGMYAALAGEYGEPSDVGAISVLSLNDGPFFTLIALGASGLATIPYMTLVACVVPIIIGFILGNLDEDLRKFLDNGTKVLIPFFAFPLGASLNFGQIFQAGLPGILLGVICTLTTGIAGFFVMKLLKAKNPAVGAAVGTTAGNAVGTPESVSAVDPTIAAIAAVSTVQIATAVIVTAILCPILVSYLDKVVKKKQVPVTK